MSIARKALILGLATVTACGREQPIKATKWLISMPVLEQEQAVRPVYLKTSENWDRRLNLEAEVADPSLTKSAPLMAKLIRCGPQSVTMISSPTTANVVDMPVRYAVIEQGRSDVLENCLRSALPSGFQMKLTN